MLKGAHVYVKGCLECLKIGQPIPTDWMSDRPIVPLDPHQKWGLDFVRPISPCAGSALVANAFWWLHIMLPNGLKQKPYRIIKWPVWPNSSIKIL